MQVFTVLDGYDEQYIPSLLAILNTLAVKIHEWMPVLKVERPVQPRDYESDTKPDPPDHQKLAVKVVYDVMCCNTSPMCESNGNYL